MWFLDSTIIEDICELGLDCHGYPFKSHFASIFFCQYSSCHVFILFWSIPGLHIYLSVQYFMYYLIAQ